MHTAFTIIILFFLASCDSHSDHSSTEIQISVVIPTRSFSKDTTLKMVLYNLEDKDMHDQHHIYEKKVVDIKDTWTITTQDLTIGKVFVLSISGRSSDECNGIGTQYEGLLQSPILTLTDLTWLGTQIACL